VARRGVHRPARVAPLTAALAGFEQLRREVIDLLIQCAVDAGKANDVISLAAAALDADPLREPAVLLLMRALAATGQAPQALHTGRAFRQRLAEETGLDPSPELAVHERAIAQGTIGPFHSGAIQQTTPTSARPAGRLIGRDAQLTAVHRLLTTERLVTIVGAGGVGKTRLALEVARRADTATVLLLAPVTDPASVPHALAAALGLGDVRGDMLAACTAVLRTRPHLLVVDNCEHLLGAAADLVAALLNGCPGKERVEVAVWRGCVRLPTDVSSPPSARSRPAPW
jgi:hypothetical protein